MSKKVERKKVKNMVTIFKYPLQITDKQTITLPKGSKILSVQMQDGGAYLWALVDTEQHLKESIGIAVFGTGHPIENIGSLEFISTIQLAGGALVFHVFKYRV